MKSTVRRGQYIGHRIDGAANESDHFYRCRCGAWVDKRDLGMVFDHEGPTPHPDRPNQQEINKARPWVALTHMETANFLRSCAEEIERLTPKQVDSLLGKPE